MCARPGGFALWSKRGPARKTEDSAERRCRCPTVVAQPGAAKLQQQHHVPVMLRCSGADPPARSHQSAVRTRLSSWGDFPIFSSLRRDAREPLCSLGRCDVRAMAGICMQFPVPQNRSRAW